MAVVVKCSVPELSSTFLVTRHSRGLRGVFHAVASSTTTHLGSSEAGHAAPPVHCGTRGRTQRVRKPMHAPSHARSLPEGSCALTLAVGAVESVGGVPEPMTVKPRLARRLIATRKSLPRTSGTLTGASPCAVQPVRKPTHAPSGARSPPGGFCAQTLAVRAVESVGGVPWPTTVKPRLSTLRIATRKNSPRTSGTLTVRWPCATQSSEDAATRFCAPTALAFPTRVATRARAKLATQWAILTFERRSDTRRRLHQRSAQRVDSSRDAARAPALCSHVAAAC